MLFSTLWAYLTSIKTATGFKPFHRVHGVELVLPIECQIPSLCLAVKLFPITSPLEERLLQLKKTIEDCRASLQAIEAAKTWSKSHYESHIHPHTFSEGDMVLVYDQPNHKLEKGKFKSIWYGPYIIHHCLRKGAYTLIESDGKLLENPHNGLYLKIFYA